MILIPLIIPSDKGIYRSMNGGNFIRKSPDLQTEFSDLLNNIFGIYFEILVVVLF